MIKQIYRVTYRDSFGYAETEEEAIELEKRFKARYSNEAFQSFVTENNNYLKLATNIKAMIYF